MELNRMALKCERRNKISYSKEIYLDSLCFVRGKKTINGNGMRQ